VNGFLQSLRNLGPARLAAMAGVGVALIGFFIFLTFQMSSQPMELLFSDLSKKDAGAIAKQLGQRNIRYDIRQGGSAIYVPANKVNQARVQMAQEGLPTGGKVGYEIFDKQDALGTTSFVQNVNLMRALEGELSRTIQSIQGVDSAQVHLVMPKREMFTRETRKPSASIVLNMKRDTRLSDQQVMAIQNLVAAGVPKLQPGRVSIVDGRGNLLSEGLESGQDYMMTKAEEMRAQTEQRISRQVESLLAQSLGYNQVRAQVSVAMDFNKVKTTKESYDPDEQVVRSTQTVEESSQRREKDQSQVSVQENVPADQQQQQGAGFTSRSQQDRTEETVNYEISRTVQNLSRKAGVIERISVAVLVDGTYTTNEQGDRVYEPRSEEQMQKLETLVRSAIGYNGERGDEVRVVNMPFKRPAKAEEEKPAMLWGFKRSEILRIAEILVLSIVAILVIMLVVRPLVSRAFESMPSREEAGAPQVGEQRPGAPALTGPPGGAEEEEEEEMEELIDLDRVEGRVKASSIKKIGNIVEQHPEEALSIVRNWLYSESG